MILNQFFNRVLVLVTVVMLAVAAIVTPAYAFVQTDVDLLKETNKCIACDLSNADLSNSNLKNAKLTGANLSNANLTDAILAKANLINANLKGATVDQTYLIENTLLKCTILPDGTSSKGCK